MLNDDRPKVGVGVIIVRDNKVLLGKRKGAHGTDSWSFPGGHLEFRERIEDCAVRETKEETGLEIEDVRITTFTNDIFHEEGKHYVTLYTIAKCPMGSPSLMEPEKCERWGWFAWSDLPTPLFLPVQNLLKQKYDPFQ